MQGRRASPFALMLLMQLAGQVQQLPYKPPLTLALIAVQTLLHFVGTGHHLADVRGGCRRSRQLRCRLARHAGAALRC
jgi:hypothetical protein